MITKKLEKQGFSRTYKEIRFILETARKFSYNAVNFAMVKAYWEIGRTILEEEQRGKERAKFGEYLIKELSQRLSKEYGQGFTQSNLWYMKQFYLMFPILHSLRGELT